MFVSSFQSPVKPRIGGVRQTAVSCAIYSNNQYPLLDLTPPKIVKKSGSYKKKVAWENITEDVELTDSFSVEGSTLSKGR